MKKSMKLLLVLTMLMLTLTGCCLKHTWKDATCTEPQTCSECAKTKGEPLGHVWKDATCTEPQTCETCGATEGVALGHDWEKATCTEPQTCATCSVTEGEALGHDWEEATCQAPQTCKTCNAKEGEALEHNWFPATCVSKSFCTGCGKNTGKLADHTYERNTCTLCGDLMIETYDELRRYLEKNYGTIETPVGTVKSIKFNIVEHDPPLYDPCDYELQIETDLWCRDANASLYSLITRDFYTYEERLASYVKLLEFAKEVSQIAMDAFPDKKMKGYYFDYGYEYPAIKVGYNSTKYLMFANFSGAINGYDYKATKLTSWFIYEPGGDQFLCNFHDDGDKMRKDAKKATGFDITYSYRY